VVAVFHGFLVGEGFAGVAHEALLSMRFRFCDDALEVICFGPCPSQRSLVLPFD